MQRCLNIISINGKDGALQYLNFSDLYLKNKSLKIRTLFPDIYSSCPICKRSACAIWKGYYLRRFFDPELNFDGQVIIRKAICRTKKINLSYLPDFMIPRVFWSRYFLIMIIYQFQHASSFFKAMIWEIPFSTMYWLGQFIIKTIRINPNLINMRIPDSNCIREMQIFEFLPVDAILLNPKILWPSQINPSSRSPPSS